MKRLFITLLIFSILINLIGCSRPEDSLKNISFKDIPEEVTQDFELPKGTHGEITYTSNKVDVIKIVDKNVARVNQQDEDVVVEIRATVKEKFVNFYVKVLKIGSEKTPSEKSDELISNLGLVENINEPIKLIRSYEHIKIDYKITKGNQVSLLTINEELWLKPELIDFNEAHVISIKTYTENEEIKTYNINFNVIPRDPNNIYLKIAESFEKPLSLTDNLNIIEEDIILPTKTKILDNIDLHWYSLDNKSIRVLKEHNKGYITRKKKDYKTSLYLTIIDYDNGLQYTFEYQFIIKAK